MSSRSIGADWRTHIDVYGEPGGEDLLGRTLHTESGAATPRTPDLELSFHKSVRIHLGHHPVMDECPFLHIHLGIQKCYKLNNGAKVAVVHSI